ncbi:hypothetical protein [Streptomyces sp. KL116D]
MQPTTELVENLRERVKGARHPHAGQTARPAPRRSCSSCSCPGSTAP